MKELKVAITAARAAAKIINKFYGKKFKVKRKGEIDLVTEVDERAQKEICRVIWKAFPKDAILAEEFELSKTAGAARRWIVDPIDGTTNFAHGYPKFCVSIAFEKNGELECGVILDPVMKEVFTAARGKGAFLNGKRLKISKAQTLKESLLVTGFPYDLDDPRKNNIPFFLHMIRKAQAIRRDGSAALNLAYVAAGRFDGFWELGLNAWDVAAGILLVKEAGGEVRHITGRANRISDPELIAGNTLIAQQLTTECSKVSEIQRYS